MKVTNNTNTKLVLADGSVLGAGQSVDADIDDKHHVTKAWLDAGVISIDKPKTTTKRTTKTSKED